MNAYNHHIHRQNNHYNCYPNPILMFIAPFSCYIFSSSNFYPLTFSCNFVLTMQIRSCSSSSSSYGVANRSSRLSDASNSIKSPSSTTSTSASTSVYNSPAKSSSSLPSSSTTANFRSDHREQPWSQQLIHQSLLTSTLNLFSHSLFHY